MTTELFSLGGLVVLSLLLYFQHKMYSERISELTKALIAKNAQEFADLKRVDKPTVEEESIPEEISLSDLSDDKWLEAVNKS
jgi:hypothetical protein